MFNVDLVSQVPYVAMFRAHFTAALVPSRSFTSGHHSESENEADTPATGTLTRDTGRNIDKNCYKDHKHLRLRSPRSSSFTLSVPPRNQKPCPPSQAPTPPHRRPAEACQLADIVGIEIIRKPVAGPSQACTHRSAPSLIMLFPSSSSTLLKLSSPVH
jgi:hypothetical protein